MSLTRGLLKTMGIEDDKAQEIIEAHLESVNALKAKIAEFDSMSEKLKDAESRLATAETAEDYKVKFEEERKAFEAFKANIDGEKTRAAKEKAVRDYLQSNKIENENLDIAMRGCREEMQSIELEDGKIKNTEQLDSLINGVFARLVSTEHAEGAPNVQPLAGGGARTMTRAEIMQIKDPEARQKAIAENPTLFGL